MKRIFTINEILFELYILFSILGGILKCVVGSWEPVFETFTFVSESRVGTLFSCLSVLIILVLIFRCNIMYHRLVPKRISYLNILLVCYYFIWTILSLHESSIKNVFFGGIATSVILLPLCYSIAFDSKVWDILKKRVVLISIILAIAFFFAVFLFWGEYGMIWPTYASYKGIFIYWITTVWLLNFIYCYDKTKRKFIYVMDSLVVVAAFIIQSRAWVLQVMIMILVTFVISGKKSYGSKIMMGCIFVAFALLTAAFMFPNVIHSLIERGLQDTRSGQYVVFFSQHKFTDLFLGLGINATYKYLGNNYYPYFDNQFMFIMFHYGMLPVIAWLNVYFSVYKKYNLKELDDKKNIIAAKVIGMFVVMAYLGLSTYYQVELGYSSVLIMIIIGNAIKKLYVRS